MSPLSTTAPYQPALFESEVKASFEFPQGVGEP